MQSREVRRGNRKRPKIAGPRLPPRDEGPTKSGKREKRGKRGHLPKSPEKVVNLREACGNDPCRMLNRPKQAYRDAWCRVRNRLRPKVSNLAFRNWLQPLELQRVVEDGLHAILIAPTRALQYWATKNDYDRRLLALWQPEDERLCRITIAEPPSMEDEEFGDQMPNDPVFGGEAGAEHQAAWRRVLESLRLEVGNDVFNWLRRLELGRVDPLGYVSVTVVAPTTFMAAWVRTYYRDELFAAWRAEDERVRAFAIVSPPLVLSRRDKYEVQGLLAARYSQQSGSRRTGPRSHLPEMEEALRMLLNEGRKFRTKKAAYRAVLERLKVSAATRGWSYATFARLKF
jgi:chromosomal replication initiation ATPase DnaA